VIVESWILHVYTHTFGLIFQPKPKFMNFTKTSILRLFVIFAFVSIACPFQALNAQAALPNQAFHFNSGYSTHGTGDMLGITFGAGYITYLSKKVSLDFNMRAHIHSSKDELIVYSNSFLTGRRDQSVRFTTAGVQLGINGGYSILRNRHHEFMVNAGAFGRYQSASNGSDGYSLYSPGTTGQTGYLVGYDNSTPQQTISAGYLFQVQYNYTLKNNIYLGLAPGFQNDTNGDVIVHAGLAIGKRF
jgi:hypothetical protein